MLTPGITAVDYLRGNPSPGTDSGYGVFAGPRRQQPETVGRLLAEHCLAFVGIAAVLICHRRLTK